MGGRGQRGFFKKRNGPTGNSRRGGYQEPKQYEQTDGEVNAGLSEKFKQMGRPRFGRDGKGSGDPEDIVEMKPRHRLLEQFERETTENQEGWRALPEIPTPEEITRDNVELPVNNIETPFESVDDYLSTHYELLREDATSHLREGVAYLRLDPHMLDNSEFCVYESVRIIGFTFAHMGVCTKVSFSLARAGKRIPWTTSKRLLPGSIVVLSCDNFKTVKVATVAARPNAGLTHAGDPEVDLLFSVREIELDTSKTYVMFESRSSYFEAYKHTLVGLQRMNESNFPLAKHLAMVDTQVEPPKYVLESPEWNMSEVFPDAENKDAVKRLNVLEQWPENLNSTMDDSQKEALSRILTKKVAIVQGPPGTGKTFTSVQALKAILSNMKEGDPPIVVACQTNHALDQLLNYIVDFEPNIVRLGGRTQDRDKIKKRTLYELTRASSIQIANSSFPRTRKTLENIKNQMRSILDAFRTDFITPKHFLERNLLSPEQFESFARGNQDWVSAEEDASAEGDISSWLGRENIQPREQSFDKYLDFEEEDLEMERIQELEAEFLNLGEDEEFDDSLRGQYEPLSHKHDARETTGVLKAQIEKALQEDDVWQWPPHIRLAVYNHLRAKYLKKVIKEFRDCNDKYFNHAKDIAVAKREKHAYILESAKLIGMTTTGLAKYRTLVAAVQPRVVMIEEAAESLEGPLIVGCTPSVQQLILVGDHRQLTGTCAVKDLEKEPYFLCVSMFERLVNNNMGYTMLSAQRRMRPDIRELIFPIYKDKLHDHESVILRESVKGMNGVNVFFYTHDQYEGTRDGTSKMNDHEAKMIAEFCNHLLINKNDASKITILTFYAGQKFTIYKELRNHQGLRDAQIRVATVDAYQGEENDIVILSLVRSNADGKIGFLSVENRVCVALSRARLGFYIFGNAGLVTSANRLWWDVGQILSGDGSQSRIQDYLPITCQRHRETLKIYNIHDWSELTGGCRQPCGEVLSCGHQCILRCHPFDHTDYRCPKNCGAVLPCGHGCDAQCFQTCSCKVKCKESKNHLLKPNGVGNIEPSVNTLPAHGGQDIRYQPTLVTKSPPQFTVPTGPIPKAPSFARSSNTIATPMPLSQPQSQYYQPQRQQTEVRTRVEKLIDFGDDDDEEDDIEPIVQLPPGPPPPIPPPSTRPPVPPAHTRPTIASTMAEATSTALSPSKSWDRSAHVSPTYSHWDLANPNSPPQHPRQQFSQTKQAEIQHWEQHSNQYTIKGALPANARAARDNHNGGRTYGAVVNNPVGNMTEEAWPSLSAPKAGKQRQNGGNANWATKAGRKR